MRELRWDFDPAQLDLWSVSGDEHSSIFFSPYDVPASLTFRLYPQNSKVVVQFKYMGDKESRSRVKIENGLTLWLGRRSGRILAMEIDTRALKSDEIREAVADLSEALARVEPADTGIWRRKKRPHRADNFETTSRIMTKFLDENSSKFEHA